MVSRPKQTRRHDRSFTGSVGASAKSDASFRTCVIAPPHNNVELIPTHDMELPASVVGMRPPLAGRPGLDRRALSSSVGRGSSPRRSQSRRPSNGRNSATRRRSGAPLPLDSSRRHSRSPPRQTAPSHRNLSAARRPPERPRHACRQVETSGMSVPLALPQSEVLNAPHQASALELHTPVPASLDTVCRQLDTVLGRASSVLADVSQQYTGKALAPVQLSHSSSQSELLSEGPEGPILEDLLALEHRLEKNQLEQVKAHEEQRQWRQLFMLADPTGTGVAHRHDLLRVLMQHGERVLPASGLIVLLWKLERDEMERDEISVQEFTAQLRLATASRTEYSRAPVHGWQPVVDSNPSDSRVPPAPAPGGVSGAIDVQSESTPAYPGQAGNDDGAASTQPGETPALLAFRSELQTMTLGALNRRAMMESVEPAALEKALDAGDSKAISLAIIELLVAGHSAEQPPLPQLHTESIAAVYRVEQPPQDPAPTDTEKLDAVRAPNATGNAVRQPVPQDNAAAQRLHSNVSAVSEATQGLLAEERQICIGFEDVTDSKKPSDTVLVSKPSSQPASLGIDEAELRRAFIAYCETGTGNSHSHDWITNAKFVRMMIDCGVVTNKRHGLSKARADLIFAKTLRLGKRQGQVPLRSSSCSLDSADMAYRYPWSLT